MSGRVSKRSIAYAIGFLAVAFSAYAADIDARGEPPITVGKEPGFFVWADGKALHIRWTSNDKPVLFTGSIEVDGTGAAEITRINPLAGGWVDKQTDNSLFFSATATAGLDGADIALPKGGGIKLDVYVDGIAAKPEQVNVGGKLAHPKTLPFRFKAR